MVKQNQWFIWLFVQLMVQFNGVFLVVGQITWLVYIIGYCIGSRVSFSSTEEHDHLDGELCTRYELSFKPI